MRCFVVKAAKTQGTTQNANGFVAPKDDISRPMRIHTYEKPLMHMVLLFPKPDKLRISPRHVMDENLSS
ncbi:LOW QUALITY PROTEIN: hypothetical protein MAR_036200, partial [Mya arenaria]